MSSADIEAALGHRFADPALKARLEGHAAKVKRRLAPKKGTPAKPAQPVRQETAKPAQPAQPAQPARQETAKPVTYEPLLFGNYPHTAGGGDHTPIEWLILEERQGNWLLLSRFGLDARAFQPAGKELTGYERQLLGQFRYLLQHLQLLRLPRKLPLLLLHIPPAMRCILLHQQ